MTQRFSLLVGTAAVIVLLGAGCSKPANTTENTNAASATNTSTGVTQAVSITNFSFSPGTLTVTKGTTVTWTNNDTTPHTVTGSNGGPSSSTLNSGDSYSFTFDTVGSFSYQCNFHGTMTGTVTVTN